ncbi:FAD-dependent oxidoreductase [Arthrobacter sp. CAN_C5]|uniref:FAD-dependent oxidoreductase n=1 Tax=Arthrobacter sp. CAN_C5 TaxID=2760706 RepID=UPI001AE2F00B|nr:NAD(P)/FAD-dependent oxidoreductase [Arthrobacter sp. CAN_C5]MBP2217100.1 NADPH-dependent 2,4-dienoyl-CoA reductase/sulfur reductase-like enzyme [Arthrobacter sp. CAN_C5]
MEPQEIVIVGAGAAGLSAAATVRAEGFEGSLTVINGEAHRPYNRTLVNKALLSGLLTAEQIVLPDVTALGADLVQGKVVSVDTHLSLLTLEDGRQLRYDALIAATGSAPQSSGRATDGRERVYHLHTVDDAARLRARFGKNPGNLTVTILGAGFIGSEAASYLAEAGAQVHLISRSSIPLASALGEHIAERITDLHHIHVKPYFGRSFTGISTSSDSATVTLSDGNTLESDIVLIAHGTRPTSAWLTGGDDGLAVDSHLRARDYQRVYGAGSLALHTASNGQLYRVDHWDAAVAQGTHAAQVALRELTGARDPGPYVPATGFTITLYQHSAAAYGLVLPGSAEHQHDSGSPEALLTSFHKADGAMTAVAGLDAFSQLIAARGKLTAP